MATNSVVDWQEWEYSMRRQMQEIIPHIWLGPYGAALKTKVSRVYPQCISDQLCSRCVRKAEELDRARITHIICVRQQCEAHWIRPNFTDKYHYLTLDIADSPTQNIIRYFPEVWFQSKSLLFTKMTSNTLKGHKIHRRVPEQWRRRLSSWQRRDLQECRSGHRLHYGEAEYGLSFGQCLTGDDNSIRWSSV